MFERKIVAPFIPLTVYFLLLQLINLKGNLNQTKRKTMKNTANVACLTNIFSLFTFVVALYYM